MKYLDTNILVYALQSDNPRKQEIALSIIKTGFEQGDAVISTQVLSELCNIMYKKLNRTQEQNNGALNFFKDLCALDVGFVDVQTAVSLKDKYQIQYYDAQHLAAARRLNCQEFYSEDLSDGQVYEGIKVINPFRGKVPPRH